MVNLRDLGIRLAIATMNAVINGYDGDAGPSTKVVLVILVLLVLQM